MKKNILLVLSFAMLLNCTSESQQASDPQRSNGWINLLDHDLSQWDSYLSYRFKPGYDGSKPEEEPIGLNKSEAQSVFSIENKKEQNETPILKISGEIYGAIITKEIYENYHLKMKVKWGNKKWDPRKNLLRDSGILYHSVGSYGAEYWRSWMQAQELQIMEGHMGDYWSQATSAMDVRAYTPEYIMNPIGSISQPFLSVGHKQNIQGLVIRSDNHESPNGKWTELELITYQGKSLHIVNGHIVMVLKNSRYEKGGKMIPLTKGKIQIQSEAAEVYFKDIQIKKIDTLSNEHAKLFVDI